MTHKMAVFDTFFKKLDQRHFLGLKIWEFSIKSLIHQYGLIFIWEVMIKHCRKTLTGLSRYRKFVQQQRDGAEMFFLSEGAEKAFLQSIDGDESELLVAVGFCQKTMRNENTPWECPSGRFNHNCFYFDNQQISSSTETVHPACKLCDVRMIGERALKAGAQLHIMTSAKDIARDILIPSLKYRKFPQAIFFLCPYSAQPMLVPLFICGINALLIKFRRGDCENYKDFIRADRGIKDQQTEVSEYAITTAFKILDTRAKERARLARASFKKFKREGNFYLPEMV